VLSVAVGSSSSSSNERKVLHKQPSSKQQQRLPNSLIEKNRGEVEATRVQQISPCTFFMAQGNKSSNPNAMQLSG